MATVDTLLSIELRESLFSKISKLVKGRFGINLHDGKKELVKARLTKRLRQLHMTSFEEYFDFLKSDSNGTEMVAMIDALSTNLTSFFREKKHFDFLTGTLVPEFVNNASKVGQKRLRVWSSGCSSGEEPYSLGITLSEALSLHSWNVKILATDISSRMLAAAKAGVYSAERLNGVLPQFRSRYFEMEGDSRDKLFRVKASLRKLVHFGRLNLMGSWPMSGPFDVIFCRNVMIYFDKKTQGELVNRYWQLLRPGGVLFVGHSESLTGIKHQFKYVQPTVYRR